MADYLVNEQIKDRLVRVISEEGQQLGIKSLKDALQIASEKNLDLVKVSESNPPVCKIMNYNKFKYEQKKKLKEQQKKQTIIEVKEIQIHMTTAENDLLIKGKQLEKFLSKGNHVRITMKLRGREASRPESAVEVMNQFIELLKKNNINFKMKNEVKVLGRNIECCVIPE